MTSLQFHAHEPRGRCILAFVSALSIVERAVAREEGLQPTPSVPSWSKFLEQAKKIDALVPAKNRPRRPGTLKYQGQSKKVYFSNYFIFDRDHVQLSSKTGINTIPMHFISLILSELIKGTYFQTGRPLADMQASNRYAGFATAFREYGNEGNLRGLWTGVALDDEMPGEDAGFVQLLRKISGGTTAPHPDFPSLDIFDPLAIEYEFGRPSERAVDDENIGLFFVIREPRGWVAHHTEEHHSLVRDALCIFPNDVAKEKGFDGYYTSIHDYKNNDDNGVFVVRVGEEKKTTDDARRSPASRANPRIEAAPVTIRGEFARLDKIQRFNLVFDRFTDAESLRFRHGILTGTTNNPNPELPRIGAWKTLLVRPDWSIINDLEWLLYRSKATSTVIGILSDVRAVGELFSHKYSNEGTRDRPTAFRRLVASNRSLIRTDGIDTIAPLVGDLENNWHLVEPAQIMTFEQPNHDAELDDEIRNNLELLLQDSHIRVCGRDLPQPTTEPLTLTPAAE